MLYYKLRSILEGDSHSIEIQVVLLILGIVYTRTTNKHSVFSLANMGVRKEYCNHRPPGTVIDCIRSAALPLKKYFWTRHLMKDFPRSQLSVPFLRENLE